MAYEREPADTAVTSLDYNANLTLEEAGLTGDRPSAGQLNYNMNLTKGSAGIPETMVVTDLSPYSEVGYSGEGLVVKVKKALSNAARGKSSPTLIAGIGLIILAGYLMLRKPKRSFAGRRRSRR